MSWFYTTTVPEQMDPGLRGPFASQDEAETKRANEVSDEPTWTVGAVFEEAEDYRLPVPVMIVAREGTDWVVYSDGSEKQKV